MHTTHNWMKSGILAHTNAFLFNSIFRQMQTENLFAPTQSDSSSIFEIIAKLHGD